MEEDMMNMQVNPVMMPDQGTPMGQQMPDQMQSDLDQISVSEQEEAKQALMQIIKFYNKWYPKVLQMNK